MCTIRPGAAFVDLLLLLLLATWNNQQVSLRSLRSTIWNNGEILAVCQSVRAQAWTGRRLDRASFFLVWIIWVSQTNWKTNWKTLARLQQTPSICWGSLSQNGNRIGPAFTTTTTCTTRVNKQTLARVSFCFQLLLLSSRRLVSVTSFRCAHSARTHLPPIIYLRALSVCSPCPDFRNNPLIASTNKSNFNHPLSLLTRAIMTDFTVKGHFLFPLSVSSRQYCSRQYKTTHDTQHI